MPKIILISCKWNAEPNIVFILSMVVVIKKVRPKSNSGKLHKSSMGISMNTILDNQTALHRKSIGEPSINN